MQHLSKRRFAGFESRAIFSCVIMKRSLPYHLSAFFRKMKISKIKNQPSSFSHLRVQTLLCLISFKMEDCLSFSKGSNNLCEANLPENGIENEILVLSGVQ